MKALEELRHRPPVDVRRRSCRPSRTAATSGRRARRWCRRWTGVRRRRAAGAPLRAAGRLRLHRLARERPRRDRRRRAQPRSTGCAASTSAADDGTGDQAHRARRRAEAAGRATASRRSTPARSTRSRCSPTTRVATRRPRRPLRAVPAADGAGTAGAAPRAMPEDLAPDELTAEHVRGAALAAPAGGRSSWAPTAETGASEIDSRPAGRSGRTSPVRPVRGRRRSREPRRCSSSMSLGRDHPRRRPEAAHAAPRWSGSTPRRRGGHRAERPLRPVRQEGHGLALARLARSSCSRSRWTRRRRCSPQPKQRRRGGRRSRRCEELGADPVSGKPMVVKDGRFGPYVTDGETNASLRAGDDVEALT